MNTFANGYRLPTQAEWEYAAKGGPANDGYTYSGGNNVNSVAWYDGNSGRKTHEVKTKAPNSAGIYDMSGNVSELCWDVSSSKRVNCGGAWGNSASDCVVSGRGERYPYIRNYSIGFRVVRKAD